MRAKPAFISITKSNGESQPLPRKMRQPVPTHNITPFTDESVGTSTDTDEFYDRLQGIWDRVLRFEDLGLIHTESDKFRYAYQLAEAELRELCLQNTVVHQ